MEWRRYLLRDLAPPVPAQNSFDPDALVWQLGLDQIDSHTGAVLWKLRAPAAVAGNSTIHFDESHVLYSKLRPYLNKVVLPDESGIATSELIPLQPRPQLVSRAYLAYYLRSPGFLSYATQYVTGAKMPRVMLDKFWQHELQLPPLSEQHRIVEVLEQVDRLYLLRTEASAKADRILPALFIRMFGDPVTNPRGWPVKLLGKLGELERGRSAHRPRNDPALLGGPHPLIQTGEVANCKGRIREFTQTYSGLGLAQSRMWPAGTLCITIAANIASTGVLEFDACFPDSVVGFVPGSGTTTEYVQFFLFHLKDILERNAPQLAQKNINLKVLRSLVVPVPPIELKRQFSSYVCGYYDSRARQTAAEAVLDRLFGSMMKQAFSGDLTRHWRKVHASGLCEGTKRESRNSLG